MFGTLILRFAFYARLMCDFSVLPYSDQAILLKNGALEMCHLRGALVFDPTSDRWPNVNMSLYANAPVLKVSNMNHMTSSKLFQKHMEFIAALQKLDVDEPTIMLLILIVLFTPEQAGLERADAIAAIQDRYSSILQRYVNWRYGPSQGPIAFAKVINKLSDLRELSDLHNQHHLFLSKSLTRVLLFYGRWVKFALDSG